MVIISAIARVGDTITGTCTGTYEHRVTEPDGGHHYVTRTETGYVTGTITSGSSIMFDGDKAMSRVGDSVSITKHYSHSNHNDSLHITGTISTGSSTLHDDDKAIAHIGSKVSADGCDITINSGSNTLSID